MYVKKSAFFFPNELVENTFFFEANTFIWSIYLFIVLIYSTTNSGLYFYYTYS